MYNYIQLNVLSNFLLFIQIHFVKIIIIMKLMGKNKLEN